MLSISNITNAAQASAYFSKDDYYLDRDQREPSAWWGRGAEHLGLSGEVDREAFKNLLLRNLSEQQATDKVAGQGVAKDPASSSKKRRIAIDLTFSAPKSVSLMALVAGDLRVAQAHGKAVETALAYLQDEAAAARVTSKGKTSVERTDNFVVARFHHDTSRELDPQMHTHCVVMNLTQRQDGAWRALSNEGIYRRKMAAGAVYRAELAHALREMGYGIEKQHADGRFELRGFNESSLQAFSTRRADIEAKLNESHSRDAKTAARVTLLTRQSKRDVDRARLGAAWQKRASELRIDFDEVRRGFAPDHPLHRATPEQSLNHAIAHISERVVRCDEPDLVRHSLGRGMGFVRYEDVKQAVRGAHERGDLIDTKHPSTDKGHERRYVTREMLALEGEMLDILNRGKGRYAPIATSAPSHEPAKDLKLTAGQQKAVDLITTSKDAVIGVQGYAGTGKTTMLREVKQHAEAAGYELSGYAPSGAAAEVIQTQTGIRSQTIARHLADAHKEAGRSADKTQSKPQIWVVDELSMVGNRDMLALLRLADKNGARLVFLGDKKQLPSIAAGKAFDLLMTRGMATATMSDIIRQTNPTIKKAVLHAIDRKPADSFDLIPVIKENAEDIPRRLAQDFLAVPAAERCNAMVVTLTHKQRHAASLDIRRGLFSEGILTGEDESGAIFVKEDLTRAQARESAHYQVGHVVRFGREYKTLGVEKGEYLKISGVDIPTNTITLKGANGAIAWRPHKADKVEIYRTEARSVAVGDLLRWTRNDDDMHRRNGSTAPVVSVSSDGRKATVLCRGERQDVDLTRPGHWEYAYVSTLNGAQGSTAERVFLGLLSKAKEITGLESWYVGISRAKAHVTVYTDDEKALPKVIARSMEKESALQLREERAEELATKLRDASARAQPAHSDREIQI